MCAVIVDTATYDSNLPYSLHAVFILDGSDAAATLRAREVHSGFLAAYPALTADDVPLLRLSLSNPEAPFSVVAPVGR